MAEPPVAVVGAGFTGTLLAIDLLRHGASVVLIERDAARIAGGVAFGAARPELLLNVRAANMSAFPHDPGHFLRWLGDAAAAPRFVPRLTYGRYVAEQLAAARAEAGDRLRVVAAEAVAAERRGEVVSVALGGGGHVAARALVLAVGNAPPAPLAPFAGLPTPPWFPDPWNPAATAHPGDAREVLLIGSGLTAVDVALSLDHAGWRGRITALSRHGLAPRAHADSGPAVAAVERPAALGAWLLHAVRRRAETAGWRAAVDELRPHTQDLWRRHDAAARRRLLTHLRPWWDVHRHRVAPQVAARLDALREEGRLRFVAGRVAAARLTGGAVLVIWQPRGGGAAEELAADRVINCTGPEGDIARHRSPLVASLLAAGALRPDALRLGIDVDAAARAIGADGAVAGWLYAAGPVTKGEAWEIVAVPDIRRQVWEIARRLTNTHWVEGEGI